MATIEYNNIKNYKTKSFPTRKEIKKEKKMKNEEEKPANTFLDTGTLVCALKWIEPDNYDNLKPERVIYNGNATICKWPDGTKTVVKTSEDEPFVKEFGVALAIVKKLYGNRSAFLRDAANGYETPNKKES